MASTLPHGRDQIYDRLFDECGAVVRYDSLGGTRFMTTMFRYRLRHPYGDFLPMGPCVTVEWLNDGRLGGLVEVHLVTGPDL